MRNIPSLLLAWIILLTCSCGNPEEEDMGPGGVEGMRPIYSSSDDWKTIQQGEARAIQRLGKIYYKDGLIFVNELNQGIHIIDNSDPSQPQPLHFISVPGSKDIAIKGDYLYTDNVSDLVVLDISQLDNISVEQRLPGVYESPNQEFPEFWDGYFECVDPSLGTVIGWETAFLSNPQCLR